MSRAWIEETPAKIYDAAAKRPVLRFYVMRTSSLLINTIGIAVNDFNAAA
ncbi:MAG TPA: hypothetical protein VGK77_15480 [Candidatus Binatia bacterium]